jgi:hypothetical protein
VAPTIAMLRGAMFLAFMVARNIQEGPGRRKPATPRLFDAS